MTSPVASDLREPAGPRGFVVAGGRSVRMGRDKSLLAFRGSTLLEHAVAQVGAVTSDVLILCGPSRRYEDFGVRVMADEICGVGPLAGLYSALLSASVDRCARILWLGVDLPLVPPSLLSRLVHELDQAEVGMARTEHGLEPLCASFRTEPALARVRRSLMQGRLKLTTALEGLDLRPVDGDASSFANINSPSEYELLS